MESVYGVDLSYSVNKKSYNLINASSFNDFCAKTENISDGVNNVTKIVSFGEDNYGLIYKSNDDNKDKESTEEASITGFTFEKGEYKSIPGEVKKALSEIKNYSSSKNNIVIGNTPSSKQIIVFDNTISQYKTIDLEPSSNAKPPYDPDKADDGGNEDGDGDKNNDKDKDENKEKAKGDDKDAETEKDKDKDAKKEKPEANGGGDDKKVNGGKGKDKENDKEETKTKEESADSKSKSKSKTKTKEAITGAVTEKTFKTKTSIKKVFKHLLLTSNGSLYSLRPSFHKKYVNNNRIIDVECDGPRATLCLDENGVLWSFGINMFGKLGLKRNDKKQEYTNPREISIFKAYKVSDFGITNKCCMASCANGSIYGWGSYSKSSLGKDSQIWYTPKKLTTETDYKSVFKVFAGFRFIILFNTTTNKLFVINTEFGYTLLDKPKNGLIVKAEQIKFPDKDLKIVDVIPSNESAMIIAKK